MCSQLNLELFSKHLLLESVEDIPEDLPQEVENLEVIKYMELVAMTVELFVDEFSKEFEFIFEMNYSKVQGSESDFKQFVIPRCLKLSGACTYLNLLMVCSFVTHLSHFSSDRRCCTRFVNTAAACIVVVFNEKFQPVFDDMGGWTVLKSFCERALRFSARPDWLIALTGDSTCKMTLLELIASCYEENRYWINSLLNGTDKSFVPYLDLNLVSKNNPQHVKIASCAESPSTLSNSLVSTCDTSNLNGIGNQYLDIRFELLAAITRALYICQNKILQAHSKAYLESCKAIFDCKSAVTQVVSDRNSKGQETDDVPEYIINNLELAFENVMRRINTVAQEVNQHFGSIFAHDSDIFKPVSKINGNELEPSSQTATTNACFHNEPLQRNTSKKGEIKSSINPLVSTSKTNGMGDIAAHSGSSSIYSSAFSSGEENEITLINGKQYDANFEIITQKENGTSKVSPNLINLNTKKTPILYPNNSVGTFFENFNEVDSDIKRSLSKDIIGENSIVSKTLLPLNLAVKPNVKETSPSCVTDNLRNSDKLLIPADQTLSFMAENASDTTLQSETSMDVDLGRDSENFPKAIPCDEPINTEKANTKNSYLVSGFQSKMCSHSGSVSTQKRNKLTICDFEKLELSQNGKYKNYLSLVKSDKKICAGSKKVLVNQNKTPQSSTSSNRTGHSELCQWCGCLCYAYVIICQEQYGKKHFELSRTG